MMKKMCFWFYPFEEYEVLSLFDVLMLTLFDNFHR